MNQVLNVLICSISLKLSAMSLRKLLLPVCALAFFHTSCDLETLIPALNVQGDSGYTYSESRSLWLQMKEDNGDSYEYTVGVLSWT